MDAPHFAFCLPFVLLLASIALMPFIHRHWWEHHYPKVSIAFAALAAGYYFLVARDPHRWIDGMEEYISFIILLGSLYIVSGGIIIHANVNPSPLANSILLAIGAILANLVGTTGASMLLIRPFLRMNRRSLRPGHIVFFIFIVSNVGGMLTPIGDPPLFLGYLSGVPFWWMFQNGWKIWLTANLLLIGVFLVFDARIRRGEPAADFREPGRPVSISGAYNFVFVALIIFAVFRPGIFDLIHHMSIAEVATAKLAGLIISREVIMAAAALASLAMTHKVTYERNEFSFGPIREVAILFVGIFSTMVPAIHWLSAHAHRMPLTTPGQFYFTTGALSAGLDNAPTYKTLLNVEISKKEKSDASPSKAAKPLNAAGLLADPGSAMIVLAISAGAVLFGACTYIGNGPNFMVKSIAEASGVNMPGFIKYITHYALPVLGPVYVLIWILFLRG